MKLGRRRCAALASAAIVLTTAWGATAQAAPSGTSTPPPAPPVVSEAAGLAPATAAVAPAAASPTDDGAAPADAPGALDAGSAEAVAASAVCGQTWSGSRLDQCATTPSSYVYQLDSKGVMIARADYVVTHELLAQANSLQVIDVFTVRWTSTFGQYSKLTFNITAICGTGCTASGSLTTKPSPGGTSSAAFTYSGTLAGGSVVTANPQWTGFASSSDGGPGPSIGNVGITTFRCDSRLAPIGPGCVFPQGAIPTITTLASLPNIAAGIRAIQAAGGYGVPGGGLPLQRSTNPAVQSYNRGIACPSSAQPPAGTPAANTSCDEYPFATTYQGAGYVSPPGSGITWVPPSEQNSQGGLLNSFYNSQRLLDGEQFYVAV